MVGRGYCEKNSSCSYEKGLRLILIGSITFFRLLAITNKPYPLSLDDFIIINLFYLYFKLLIIRWFSLSFAFT